MQSDVLQAHQETIMTVVAGKCVYITGNIRGLNTNIQTDQVKCLDNTESPPTSWSERQRPNWR